MTFIAELRRRNVIRMAGLYLVGAWLITQVAATLLPVYDAPGWVMKAVVALLAIGFFVALVFAWVFELTPDGLKRDAEVAPEQSIAPQTAKRMDRMIVAGLIAVITLLAIERVWFAQHDVPAEAVIATEAAVSKPRTLVAATVNPKSIAVLAFANMSADKDNEYFSDGIAEEILNALAQIDDLKVAGRTSSFHFKGRNENLQTIGATLGVAHVLEGSVRKQGDKVRITAQLIRVDDGFHVWSDTYDGNLVDVFALQEQIARAITDELKVVLVGAQQQRLVPVATTNAEAYALYLRATSIFDRRDGPSFPDAVAALEQAIALDPKFARAHSRLAALHVVMGSFGGVELAKMHRRVLQHANDALALDPTLAEPHAAMGLSYGKQRGGLIQQREELDRAVQRDPDDVTSNFWSGLSLLMTGYREKGLAQIEHALAIDAMMPNVVRWRGIVFLYDNDLDRAEEFLTRARSSGLFMANRELSEIAYARGDVDEAIRLWPEGSRNLLLTLPPGSTEILASGIYGDAAARKRALQTLDEFLATSPPQVPGPIPLVLLRLGEPARATELLSHTLSGDNADLFSRMWTPLGKPLRDLPQFPEFLRSQGFFALWDKYGPPDLCQHVGEGNYRCD